METLSMMISAMSGLLLLIPILLNVAFFTLLERKVLGLSQSRKGPNKVSAFGYLQPFADAVKLFLKEWSLPNHSNRGLFTMSPMVAMFLILWMWGLIPILSTGDQVQLSVFTLLALMGLGLYPLLISGWASNSKYATVGAMRGIAQTVSYEIGLALILFSLLLVFEGLALTSWMGWAEWGRWGWVAIPGMALWLISCVAETNRTPFDFAEGESELVSGFNVEYGSGGFALIFMAEYASIYFFSAIMGLMVSSSSELSGVGGVFAILVCWGWVWARATYPRYRYDMLMGLAWKSVLPMALSLVLFFSGAMTS